MNFRSLHSTLAALFLSLGWGLSPAAPEPSASPFTPATAATFHEQCTDCHQSEKPVEGAAELKRPIGELCMECHEDRQGKGQHAMGIRPAPGGTGELPLEDGKIGCSTCHDSHVETRGLLRLGGEKLCTACHNQ